MVLFGGLTRLLQWFFFSFLRLLKIIIVRKQCWEKKNAPGLIFIVHLSPSCLCVCMFPVFICVCKREHKTEREAKCVCVCVCQRSDVIGVSCLTPPEEAGSVECGGPPVSPVFSQAPAHENLFRWIQYCHLNRYQPTFRTFKPIKDSPPTPPPANLYSNSGP